MSYISRSKRGTRLPDETRRPSDEHNTKESSQRRHQKGDQPTTSKQRTRSLASSSEKQIGADDDTSNQYFMSEPSLSDEGHDSSLSDNQQSASVSGESSASVEEPTRVDQSPSNPPTAPAVHPQFGRASRNNSAGIYSSSPGTTSLSSWDSPRATRRQVQLSFSPEKQTTGGSRTIPAAGNVRGTTYTNPLFRQAIGAADGHQFNLSSNSTSEASSAQQQQAQEFLEGLRHQSQGAMVDQPGVSSFTSFATSSQGADSFKNQLDGIIRHQQAGPSLHDHGDSIEGGRDDTVVMTLSVSDDEKDTIDSSLLKSEQSHSWKSETSPRLTDLKAVNQRGSVDSAKSKEGEERVATHKHQMSTGEPTAVGRADSRRAQPSIRSRLPTVETVSDERQQYYPAKGGMLPDQHWDAPRSNVDSMETGDSGDDHPTYPWVARFGRDVNPSVVTQSLNQQSYSGATQEGADEVHMARSLNRAPQHFGSDPSFFVGSPNLQPQYLQHDGWPMQPDPAFIPQSPSHQPQYFITPQGEMLQADPTLIPLSPSHQMQYFITPQGEMLQAAPALVAHPLNQQPHYFVAPQGDMAMPFYTNEADMDHSEESDNSETDENTDDEVGISADDYVSVQQNRIWVGQNVQNLEEAERLLENPEFRGKMQNMMRRQSVFANAGQPQEKVDRSYFMPKTSTMDDDTKTCATFTCPKCKMKQREFFSVANAPQHFETATSYLGLYFGIYVVASLFIFGLKEGWSALDCIYFAVITLTTAGLGDFTPTSDDAKIICSIFIYFGVACIGLLLGSYIAGMLDDISHREATENRINSCPNCARIKHLKEIAKQTGAANKRRISLSTRPVDGNFVNNVNAVNKNLALRRQSFSMRPSTTMSILNKSPVVALHKTPVVALRKDLPAIFEGEPKNLNDASAETEEEKHESDNHDERENHDSSSNSYSDDSDGHDVEMATSPGGPNQYASPQMPHTSVDLPKRDPYTPPEIPISPNLLGSPLTREIMGRQQHTRHISFDASANSNTRKSVTSSGRSRQFSGDQDFWRKMSMSQPEAMPQPQEKENCAEDHAQSDEDDDGSEEESEVESVNEEGTTSSEESIVEKGDTSVQNARYVFLTLKEALVNSLLIIAVGSIGFFLIEGFTAVDSWYFTTVLLTTVGYGDIAPSSNGGKLFATIYILVGGTILINNMSLISMIPLELRKRRIERAVLTQFGDQLDDAALRELATGPLVQRLRLTPTRLDGLDECTREMFALAMLVRLGKVSEQDIKETFRAFRRLDVNNDGVLTSKSIIAGMIQKRRSQLQVPAQIAAAYINPATQIPGAPVHAGVVANARGWLGPRGSFHAVSQAGNSERTSLLTDSAIYDSINSNTGTARTGL